MRLVGCRAVEAAVASAAEIRLYSMDAVAAAAAA